MVRTNMYYEDNSDLAHDEHQLRVELIDIPMTFITDAGVFSKNAIDYGSRALLENCKPIGKTLLDVGCGYGALGITLAKKYDLTTTLIDVNTRALDLARRNAKKNAVSVEVLKSNIYKNILETFDNIVSNPPIRAGKEVVHQILSGAFDHLISNGQLVVVLQKKQGAPSAQKKMLEVFGNCEIIARDKGYYVLKSVKNE